MAHKSFKRAQNLDPISFDVPGPDGEVILFNCEDEIPTGVVLAFSEVMPPADDSTDTPKADPFGAIQALFVAAIVDSQIEQFQDLIRTKEKHRGIPLSMLMEIASDLAEQYTSRPTGPSSGSGPLVKPNGSASTVGALQGVTTYSKPELVEAST